MNGALGIIFIILLILKLSGTVAWPWWIIFIPLYPVAFGVLMILAAVVIAGIAGVVASR